MKNLLFIFILLFSTSAFAQLDSNGPFIHSHNDYAQQNPLFGALNAEAKSIEIDVFLKDNELMVAHSESEIKIENTLENLYILPLQKYLEKTQNVHDFHFLIDIKSEPVSTLKAIQNYCKKYPGIFSEEGIQVVISGNRPKVENYVSYAEFIWFDARSPSEVNGNEGNRMAMISQNISKFTKWRGRGILLEKDKKELVEFINSSHMQNRHVRLWNTGDNETMYEFLRSIGVDYINTDHPKALRKYLDAQN